MNSRSFATRGEVMGLADECGAACGKLGRDLDTMSALYVEQDARIARLETEVKKLTAALSKQHTDRGRARVESLRDVASIAAE